MKKSIWKFKLSLDEQQIIKMPEGAEILTIQSQGNVPCIWALVEPDAPKENRCFEIIGTGDFITFENEIQKKYINTFQLHGGALIFHVFEIIKS